MERETPLQDAVSRNDPAAVTAALDSGETDACTREGERWSRLAEALRLGRGEAARAFLDRPGGLSWESQCWSLHGLLAGPHDDVEMLGALLARGAHLPHREGGPPLEHGLAESGRPLIVADLFRRGDLRAAVLDDAGWVPLFRCALKGDIAMAQVFFDHGAPLNSRVEWRDRRSALHIALDAGAAREAMVEWLLERGIDTRLRDEGGRTAAELARAVGEPALARLIEEGASRGGPRWHREAVKTGLNDVICSRYSRADGFCFDPNDVSQPFLIGGDHDGSFPDTLRGALEFARRCNQDSAIGRATRPWIPVIERMLDGEDVGLEDILPLGELRSHPGY